MTESSTSLITIAVLAKEKGHCLPFYLSCLERFTYPKSQTLLYIRTNNNKDNTRVVLEEWLFQHRGEYHSVYYSSEDVPEPVQDYAPHEWNEVRFIVLAKIREESIAYALQHNSHYFVIDCDNFITEPRMIELLLSTHLPVVGPLLRKSCNIYANIHHHIDKNGYYASSPYYLAIVERQVKGLIEVAVIHTTYLIRAEYLQYVSYRDGSPRHEYVIFSEGLRKKRIPQYVDNRFIYGYLTFADTLEDLTKEPWYPELQDLSSKRSLES